MSRRRSRLSFRQSSFCLARWSLPVARKVVLAGWLAAALGMLPVVLMAHKADLHSNQSIPETGRARIILWNFTANKFLERPLLGVGANATKTIDEDLKPNAKKMAGAPYAERTGQHSHNIFVQTWFELGAVGALLFLGSGFMLWRAIGRTAFRGATLCVGRLYQRHVHGRVDVGALAGVVLELVCDWPFS